MYLLIAASFASFDRGRSPRCRVDGVRAAATPRRAGTAPVVPGFICRRISKAEKAETSKPPGRAEHVLHVHVYVTCVGADSGVEVELELRCDAWTASS